MESILMFVVIAVISSFLRKDNTGKGRQTTRSPQPNTPGPKVNRVPTPTRMPEKKEVFTYDSIEEIEANYYHMKEEKVEPKEPVNQLTDYQHSNKRLKVVDVDTMELEKKPKVEGRVLNFTPNAIVQSIIMAEILDKPRSMRRK